MTLRSLLIVLLLTSIAMSEEKTSWKADPGVVEKLSKRRPDVIYDEAKVPKYELPDALKDVSNKEQWSAKRAELLERFREQMFGRSPGKPEKLTFTVLDEDTKAFSGAATLRRIAIDCSVGIRLHRYVVLVATPNNA